MLRVRVDRAEGIVVHQVQRELAHPEAFEFAEPLSVVLDGTEQAEAVDDLVRDERGVIEDALLLNLVDRHDEDHPGFDGRGRT